MGNSVTTNVSNDYLAQYNVSLGVAAVLKAGGYNYLQQLTYNAMLEWLKQNFLSLDDWAEQITAYSATNPGILGPALNAIADLIPLNTIMTANVIEITSLGLVGDLLATIPGFNTIFNLSNNNLTSTSAVASSAASI
jgi:hypothetical protein